MKLAGAFERNLLRKRNNILFGPAGERVTPADIDAASRKDQEALQAFVVELRETLERAVALEPNVDSQVVLDLKADVDALYDRCFVLPGDRSAEKTALLKLLEVLMRSVWRGAGNDLQAHAQLEEEETARRLHHELLQYPLIAELLHPDSPVDPGELLPSLLSEDDGTVRAAMVLFDTGQLQQLVRDGKVLLERLNARGYPAAAVEQKLAVIESMAGRG